MISAMAAKQADPVPDTGVSETALAVGVVITLLLAAVAGLLFEAGADPGERSVTGPWGSLAFTVVIAGPAVVAVIGYYGRPWILGAAGAALFPRMWLSFSFLFFPLVVPGVIFIIQAASMRRGAHRSRWQPVAAAVSWFLLLAAPLCLLVHQDPRTWSATGGGSTSDIVTATESALAILCVVAAVVVALLAPPDSD
jgi:hypothetical protein